MSLTEPDAWELPGGVSEPGSRGDRTAVPALLDRAGDDREHAAAPALSDLEEPGAYAVKDPERRDEVIARLLTLTDGSR